MRLCLETLELKFIAQAPVGRYSIDFAIPDEKIAIEVDGVYWHDAVKDARRDEILKKYGWRTVRFGEEEINTALNVEELVKQRLAALN